MTEAIRPRERSSAHERCPYCHEEFAASTGSEPDERVACEGCGTAHHAECFAENGGCSALGCERAVARVEGSVHPRGLARAAPRPAEDLGEDRFVVAGVAVVAIVLAVVLTIAVGPGSILPIVGLAGIVACALWLLGRGTEMLPLEEQRERPAPFAGPERGPIHGVEVLERVLARPVTRPPAPEDLREPSGATMPCPSCARPLEDPSRLTFCYHCGAMIR